MATLAELTAAATEAQEPRFTTPRRMNLGGVDPLGLRQINFDLMDKVLPGLNNVARHVRPFVVVTWAWRRAHLQAKALGRTTIKKGDLQDFVDRIEVLYALSQFLRDENTDLPGSQYLAPWLREAQLKFEGTKWQQRRKERRYSTALSAPINYGPGLRMLGWLMPHPEYSGVMIPNPAAAPALDALETEITAALGHEAFNKFGPVAVARDDVRQWGDLWALDKVTDVEAQVMAKFLIGAAAPESRRLGGKLMLAAAHHLGTTDTGPVRAAMTGPPSEFEPPDRLLDVRYKWRHLQVRQLFRLSLEAFFYWTICELDGPKRSIESLVDAFLQRVPASLEAVNAGEWIRSLTSPLDGPTELMSCIERAFGDPGLDHLPRSIAQGLAFSLTEPLAEKTLALEQRPERLPLWRAQGESTARSRCPVREFIRHVLESWVLAQHTYWSVGRGLADARTRDRMLLRLRVILDEGGWTLTPGSRMGLPRPTADRLRTALSLAHECGLLHFQHSTAPLAPQPRGGGTLLAPRLAQTTERSA